MATYRLEQTPKIFISSRYIDNKFGYVMRHFSDDHGSNNGSFIRYVDLEKDLLIIHGTEVKEIMLQKLHDFLLTKSLGAKLYVNCNGACYIYVVETKKYYRMIDNVIFDWSAFGVIVPNSVNGLLTRQLQEKDERVEHMSRDLDCAKGTLEASKKEAEELRELLATSQKDQEDMDGELQKVRRELSSREFELETKKIEFELSKEEVKGLQDQLLASKKDNQNKEKELQMIQDQLCSTCYELKSTEIMLENSKNELAQSTKEREDMKTKIQFMHQQFCSAEVESQSIKTELDSSIQRIKDLESQLSSCLKENQEIATELQNVRNEHSSDEFELELMKSQLETSNKRKLELEEQLSGCRKENKVKDAKLLELQDQLYLILNDQLQSMKIMMEFNINEIDDKYLDECFVTKAVEIVNE